MPGCDLACFSIDEINHAQRFESFLDNQIFKYHSKGFWKKTTVWVYTKLLKN